MDTWTAAQCVALKQLTLAWKQYDWRIERGLDTASDSLNLAWERESTLVDSLSESQRAKLARELQHADSDCFRSLSKALDAAKVAA